MAKVFAYDPAWCASLSRWFNPATPPSSKADQAQAAALADAGFIALYDPVRARQMHALGMLQAKTYVDGALWPYERAQWKEDGLARWGLQTDVAFFDTLVKQLNDGMAPHADNVPDLLRVLQTALTKQGQRVDPESIAALEAVVRLGTTSAVLTFLESM